MIAKGYTMYQNVHFIYEHVSVWSYRLFKIWARTFSRTLSADPWCARTNHPLKDVRSHLHPRCWRSGHVATIKCSAASSFLRKKPGRSHEDVENHQLRQWNSEQNCSQFHIQLLWSPLIWDLQNGMSIQNQSFHLFSASGNHLIPVGLGMLFPPGLEGGELGLLQPRLRGDLDKGLSP